jgi:hypothetical protein
MVHRPPKMAAPAKATQVVNSDEPVIALLPIKGREGLKIWTPPCVGHYEATSGRLIENPRRGGAESDQRAQTKRGGGVNRRLV